MRFIETRQPIDIEALLVWTYRDQRADRVLKMAGGMYAQEDALDGREVVRTSADGVAAVQKIGLLGTRVDGGGPSNGALHPDAEIVHQAVTELATPAAMMVSRHARAASRPDSMPIPTPRPVRQVSVNGRTKLAYAPWDKNGNYGWCPIAWTVSPTTIDAVHAEYALWRRVLVVLALALSRDTRLTHHRALAPKAPETAVVRFG
jgi:hypothetical protein